MALIDVHFQWDDRFGPCYDCGLPSAYAVATEDGTSGQDRESYTDEQDRESYAAEDDIRVCSVCAASRAAGGDTIVYLFDD